MKSHTHGLFWFIVSLVPLSVSGQSATEKKIGELTFRTVKETQGIYHNDAALKMVREVGHALERQLNLGYPLQYHLVDTAEPNAFATAGGYVFVTRGILALLNNRDELAGILGHEMTHVSEHHAVKTIRASMVPAVLKIPGNIIQILTTKEVGQLLNYPIDEFSKIGIAAHSREQEKIADTKGVTLAMKAGFNPYGLSEILERLTAYIENVTNHPMPSGLFVDHPVTSTRVSYLKSILESQGHQRTQFPPGTNLLELDGIYYGEDPLEGVVTRGSAFIHPAMDLYIKFPAKWSIHNSPTSVTAIDSATKSVIVVSADTAASSVSAAAELALSKINVHKVVAREATSINGHDAYRATLTSPKARDAGQLIEIMWIKTSSSGPILKIVGASSQKQQNAQIVSCFNSFRSLNESDLSEGSYQIISLRKFADWNAFDAYSKTAGASEAGRTLLRLLNGVTDNQSILDGQLVKVLETLPLSSVSTPSLKK